MRFIVLLAAALLLSSVALPRAAAAFNVSTSCAVSGLSAGAVVPSSWRTRSYTLVISDGVVVNLLGEPRPAVLVNGSTPGPRLDLDEFDWVTITVISMQVNETMTGIHWHGLHMRGTPYNDGTPGVTQCGIGPGLSLSYTFCAYPAGTYWYHGHNNVRNTATRTQPHMPVHSHAPSPSPLLAASSTPGTSAAVSAHRAST